MARKRSNCIDDNPLPCVWGSISAQSRRRAGMERRTRSAMEIVQKNRTYNIRWIVTDHRIGIYCESADRIMEGRMQDLPMHYWVRISRQSWQGRNNEQLSFVLKNARRVWWAGYGEQSALLYMLEPTNVKRTTVYGIRWGNAVEPERTLWRRYSAPSHRIPLGDVLGFEWFDGYRLPWMRMFWFRARTNRKSWSQIFWQPMMSIFPARWIMWMAVDIELAAGRLRFLWKGRTESAYDGNGYQWTGCSCCEKECWWQWQSSISMVIYVTAADWPQSEGGYSN